VRKGTLFWGVIIILVGVVLLLSNLGYLGDLDAWGLVWPLGLMALGIWILISVVLGPRPAAGGEEAVIPLEGAQEAQVRVRHGGGVLHIDASAGPGELVRGTFLGGLGRRVRRAGERLEVELWVPSGRISPFFFVPRGWGGRRGLEWSFGLNGDVRLALDLQTGAGEARIDLTELQVTDLRLQTGASSTQLALPARAGQTGVRIEGGAAAISVHVPSGVAARIRTKGGMASISIDRDRFPRQDGFYQSPDYESAANRVQIDVDIGAGSISIK
jgi:hypothetical protein